MDKNSTYSVLFVGNSYTFYNDLWDIFHKCAASAGYSFAVDHVTSGGYFLRQYLDDADPMQEEFDRKITGAAFDFAVLQEHSVGPIVDYDGFANAVKAIVNRLGPRTKTVLYETWGRQEDSGTLKKIGMTNETMTIALDSAYRRLGRELDIPVSPAGIAFRNVHVNHPEIELYDPDHTHPSKAGSYLAALVHFAVLTGDSPKNVAYDGGLAPNEAKVLREAAKLASVG